MAAHKDACLDRSRDRTLRGLVNKNTPATTAPHERDEGPYYAFNPDWTVPPAEMLLEWAEEQGMNETGLRQLLATYEHDLGELLDNPPAELTSDDARTGYPARFWERFEALYRSETKRLGR